MKKVKFKDQIRQLLLLYSVLPVLIVSIFFIVGTYVIWRSSIEQDNERKCNEVGMQIDNILVDYKQIINEINDDLINIDKMTNDTNYRLENVNKIYKFLNKHATRAEVYLLNDRAQIIYSTNKNLPNFMGESKDGSWGLIKTLNESDEVEYNLKNYSLNGTKNSQMEIGRRIIENGKTLGYIVCVINEQDLYNIIARYDNSLIIANDFGRVFVTTDLRFSDKMGKINRDELDSKEYLVSEYMVYGDNGIIIYSIASLKTVSNTIIFLFVINVIILVVMIITMVLLSYKISVSKTKIIEEIVSAFTKVQQGDLDSRLNIETEDEFEVIVSTYNTMLDSINELMKNNENQVRENIIFQIRELESQFNPHFLFNTLEVIKYSIKIDTEKARKMIISLSKILRYSIDYSISEVELIKDVDYLENYLFIASQRFGKRFSYSIDVCDDCKKCKIPKLIFQPIIENTIKYGFGDHYLMEVRVKVISIDNQLFIIFYDDGIGISKEKLEKIRNNLESDINQTEHLGLYNVHRRIRLLYGNNYGISLDSSEHNGTLIKINLPIIK